MHQWLRDSGVKLLILSVPVVSRCIVSCHCCVVACRVKWVFALTRFHLSQAIFFVSKKRLKFCRFVLAFRGVMFALKRSVLFGYCMPKESEVCCWLIRVESSGSNLTLLLARLDVLCGRRKGERDATQIIRSELFLEQANKTCHEIKTFRIMCASVVGFERLCKINFQIHFGVVLKNKFVMWYINSSFVFQTKP